MSIEFHCESCGKLLRVSERHIGRKAVCPRCHAQILVNQERGPAAQDRPHEKPENEDAPLTKPMEPLDPEELIDMTAMVDIVFFLLIFFLVTSLQQLNPSIPMPVPDPQISSAKAPSQREAVENDPSYIIVKVDERDVIRIDDVPLQGEDELLMKLRELRGGPNHPNKLLLVGHGDSSHGSTVMVIDTANEAGIERVRVSVDDKTDGG